jgi:hypothetical protein
MAERLEYIDRGKCHSMTEHTGPEKQEQTHYLHREIDGTISIQVITTILTGLVAFLGIQWQIGGLVNSVTVQLTRSELQIQELKEDVAELKARLK